MADNRTNGYAQAMLNVAAAEGNVAEVEDELYQFARALERPTTCWRSSRFHHPRRAAPADRRGPC